MRKDFVMEVAKQNGIEEVDLLEKDLILHQTVCLASSVLAALLA